MTQLRIKNSFIPWSFPELVAKEEGYFAEKGLDVSFYTLDASQIEPDNKIKWYAGLVDQGKVDAYSCCAWAALDRLSEGGRKKIIGATSSASYAFSVLVQPDSSIRDVTDLEDVEILVNAKTGSQYCNLKQLEEHLPYEKIRLTHGGAPQNRLLSLMQGKAQAASLISPYTEIAEELGYRNVFRTDMVDVLAYIARSDLSVEETSSFLWGLEKAVEAVAANPTKFKPLYLKVLYQTLSGFPPKEREKVMKAAKAIENQISVVQWGDLKPYSEDTFSTIRTWMTGHRLLEKEITYQQLVDNRPIQRIQGRQAAT